MATIPTIYGDMDDGLLTRQEGVVDNENECTTWVEYRLGDEIVHRSAHVRMKKGLLCIPEAQPLG